MAANVLQIGEAQFLSGFVGGKIGFCKSAVMPSLRFFQHQISIEALFF